ncbi:hypothetical protein LSTR_LSTR001110 [Laodelphax striatellus]|uniref:Uncharacterized protein n=1 Tax=Laodelphax striatellus TaxID=195883 RepID=A0A482X185_LAOST|nr:hypothetical protein LSTR_LSTR001110 [Laodelphax striatellus]
MNHGIWFVVHANILQLFLLTFYSLGGHEKNTDYNRFGVILHEDKTKNHLFKMLKVWPETSTKC